MTMRMYGRAFVVCGVCLAGLCDVCLGGVIAESLYVLECIGVVPDCFVCGLVGVVCAFSLAFPLSRKHPNTTTFLHSYSSIHSLRTQARGNMNV